MKKYENRTLTKSRSLLLICFIILNVNLYAQTDSDEKTFYAKKEILTFNNKETKELVSEVVVAKNITILYDETFKKISLYFISDDGSNGRIILSFIQYSGNTIRPDEMIMIDRTNNKWYIQFDPYKDKVFFMWPYDNTIVNGMTFFNKIENISATKNW